MSTHFVLHQLSARIALSGGALFGWVMFFAVQLNATLSLPHALVQTGVAYALSQIVLILLVPLAGRLYAYGVVRVMILAMLALAAALVSLALMIEGDSVSVAALGFAMGMGVYRALYATPFALVQYDMHEERYWFDVAIAYIPLLVGLLLTQGVVGESIILVCAALCALVAIVPLVRFEAYERYEWGYRETFGILLEPAHRRYVWHGFVRGVEGAALFFAWPLFVFVILGQSYLALGLVFSVSAFLLLALRIAAPERPIITTPLMAASITGASWLARIVAVGPLAVIGIQLASSAADPRRIHEHVIADHFADGGTFLDELTTLKEIALGMGRLAFAFVFAAALFYLPIAWALGAIFALAALSGGASSYLSYKKY